MLDFSQNIAYQDSTDTRFQLLQSGEKERKEIQKRRQNWLGTLKHKNKKAILFELEMLLLGIERFFFEAKYFGNNDEHLLTRDFSKEIGVLIDSISKVVRLSCILLNESDPSFSFRQYVTAKTGDAPVLGRDLEKTFEQNTPVDSLHALLSGFRPYLVLLDHLAQKGQISYQVFEQLGHLLNREMNQNKHFNPRDFVQFTPFYDKINSEIVQEIIKSIESNSLRKIASVILLLVFRILNYLKFIPRSCSGTPMIKKALIVFSLISSELKNLSHFVEQAILEAKSLPVTAEVSDNLKLRMITTLEIIKKRLHSEYHRVFGEEIKSVGVLSDSFFRSGTSFEISTAILIHTCHETAVNFVHIFDHQINGKNLFSDYRSRFELSDQLRADLLLFDRILQGFFEAIRNSEPAGKTPASERRTIARIFRATLRFTEYFETEQFPALRLKEYHTYKQYTGQILEFSDRIKHKNVSKQEVIEFKKHIIEFKGFINQSIAEINKRSELKNAPVNPAEVEKIFNDYMKQF